MTVQKISNDLEAGIGSVHTILTEDLKMHRVATKFVPKLLTNEPKQRRSDVAQNMFSTVKNDPDFLETIVTGDETWAYGHESETTQN